jgi:hypothetical protein
VATSTLEISVLLRRVANESRNALMMTDDAAEDASAEDASAEDATEKDVGEIGAESGIDSGDMGESGTWCGSGDTQ